MRAAFSWLSAALLLLLPASSPAAEALVAVASNFSEPMREIARQFEASSGHKVRLAYGSTGKLYAQIRNGAPFDVLLAADVVTPQLLLRQQQAVAGSDFIYARGSLMLWSPEPGRVDAAGQVLAQGRFHHLAIASPATAPYGAAAIEVLDGLELAHIKSRLVQGENINQAYQFVASGNAELGLVARAQVWYDGALRSGSAWAVPEALHRPLQQQAVLLEHGRDNPAAKALLAYLREDATRALIQRYGYHLEPL
jgi:molybdate transport system substrate-binding protein